MRKNSALIGLAVLGAVTLGSAAAQGALSLNMQPASPTVAAGQIEAVNVYLTGTRSDIVASIEFGLSALTGGATYTTQPPSNDGFAEGSDMTTYLTTTNDGSLFNDRFLGYAAGPGVDGIPTGSTQLQLGTFWVLTPSNVATNYSVNFTSFELLNPDGGTIATTASGTTFQTIVPEPAAMTLIGVSLITLQRRRKTSASK